MPDKNWTYKKGLHQVGNGQFAYLQPDGGWGWSNAGLIVDGDQSLLVDTLFDMSLTADMLSTMKDATGINADDIGVLVNTHANGDHTHGNGCCRKAEIISSLASAKEMEDINASMLAAMKEAAPQMGDVGKYFLQIFGQFDFAGVDERAPTKTFTGQMSLNVGDKEVSLIEVGPAHTKGDVLVHVPSEKLIYTGDILFIDSTPIMWAGPISNWLKACDRILQMDVDVIVPGHGPITDKNGVRQVRDYLSFCDVEARKRFDAGMTVKDAAHDIALGQYADWGDAERIAVNVDTLYRQYRGDMDAPPNVIELFSLMASLKQ